LKNLLREPMAAPKTHTQKAAGDTGGFEVDLSGSVVTANNRAKTNSLRLLAATL